MNTEKMKVVKILFGKKWCKLFYKVFKGRKIYSLFIFKKDINLKTGKLSGFAKEWLGNSVK